MLGDGIYKVSKIVGDRKGKEGTEYLVRWTNYPPAADTWEPLKNLKNCGKYIDYYMETKKVRRSTRLNPGITEPEISTDYDYDLNKTPKKKTSKIHAKKSTKAASTTRASDTPQDSLLFSLNLPKEPPPTYLQRSTPNINNVNIDLSSEEDLEASTVSMDTTMKKPIKPYKPRLSKKMGKTRKTVSSTPFTDVAQELDYSNLKIHSEMEKCSAIREVKAVMTEAEHEDTVSQEDSETEDEYPAAALDNGSHDSLMSDDDDDCDSSPAWMLLGWKEMALAFFLTGIGAFGYICFSTDYCSYC